MKKKIYGALVLGSLLLSGGMVSCSDYDDDINSLNERVDSIEKTLADLKAKIEAGAVITGVEPTENGVQVTLSNGETFELTNGRDGVDGQPGSTVSVDEEGYWTVDGERVTVGGEPIKAAGEKGDQGEPGTPGEDGEDGKDGIWYEPGEDGYWYKVTPQAEGEPVKEKTTLPWRQETETGEPVVTIVYDTESGKLLISGAEGMGKDETIAINITADLKSLAAIPYVWDKEMDLPVVSFYNIYVPERKVVATSTNAKAHFRLNPANADVKAWDWSMINRTVQVRAAGDMSDLLSIANTEKSGDELIVTLKSNKSLADLDQFLNERAIAALQGTNKETAEVITSDYIKVESADLTEFSIVNSTYLPKIVDEYALTAEEAKTSEADIQMVYTESLDLNDFVATWAKEINTEINRIATVEGITDEGELTYQFSLPEEFLLGDNETNQQKFVALDGSILKVNSDNYPNGTGAIGGTPIVVVRALVNNYCIATAIIKVEIVKEGQVEKPVHKVVVDETVLEYSNIVKDKVEYNFTWDAMRKIYDDLGITRDEFIEHYTPSVSYVQGVTLNDLTDDAVGTQTNAVELSFDPALVPSNVKGSITITYSPKPEDKYTYSPIVIEFPYTITHEHVSFPDLNDQYANDNMVQVRGDIASGQWTMSTQLSEHFKLNEYKPDGNHKATYAVLRDPEFSGAYGAKLTGEDLSDQVLSMTEAVVGDHVDVVVDVIAEKANGETTCVMTYTVRFLNHFEITEVTIPSLTEDAQGKPVSGKVTYTVKERFGEKRTLVNKGEVVKDLANEYNLTTVDVTYTETPDWGTEFGQNNNGDDKLNLTDNGDGTATIVWDNAGSALNKNVEAYFDLQVKIAGISVLNAPKNEVIVKKAQ